MHRPLVFRRQLFIVSAERLDDAFYHNIYPPLI
nr:MAG TPA: hypothetical protein [Caudoviricetes sp.]